MLFLMPGHLGRGAAQEGSVSAESGLSRADQWTLSGQMWSLQTAAGKLGVGSFSWHTATLSAAFSDNYLLRADLQLFPARALSVEADVLSLTLPESCKGVLEEPPIQEIPPLGQLSLLIPCPQSLSISTSSGLLAWGPG